MLLIYVGDTPEVDLRSSLASCAFVGHTLAMLYNAMLIIIS